MTVLLALAATISTTCPTEPVPTGSFAFRSAENAEQEGWDVANLTQVVRGVMLDSDASNDQPFIQALREGCKISLRNGEDIVDLNADLDNEMIDRLSLLQGRVDLNEFWDGGAEGQAKLAFIHAAYPSNSVTKFIASKLQPIWQASGVANKYAPITTELGMRSKMAEAQKDPGEQQLEKKLLFDGTKYLDTYLRNTIPDFIYNWLKP